jgi:hypothetical protein
MPAALKKRPKTAQLNAEIDPVHRDYFVSLGLGGTLCPYGSPAWRAGFAVRFGKPEYRRQAWLRLRSELEQCLPQEAFETMDRHFTTGPATHFTAGFDHAARCRLLAIMKATPA